MPFRAPLTRADYLWPATLARRLTARTTSALRQPGKVLCSAKKDFPGKDPQRLMDGVDQPIASYLDLLREPNSGNIPRNYLE